MRAGTAVPVTLPLLGVAAALPGLCLAGLPALKVCGAGAGAAGVELGASLIDRRQVNTGTALGSLPPPGQGDDQGRHAVCR
jgi:hypothetical protein